MPVGIFAHNEVCCSCRRINQIIETSFLVCQHCNAVQDANLQKEIAHFNKWLNEPVQHCYIFHTHPMKLLALHQRLGGSRHRFDHQHGENRIVPELHPTYQTCPVCNGEPPLYPATCGGCGERFYNLGYVRRKV